jgi:hypothetical protein
MQSTPTGITKACILPVCTGKKFQLVHKFPSDKERFAEWLELIQKDQKIPLLNGLTDEQIRKRFFICSRHFGMNQYKNSESRSLNITAVPHLNFTDLKSLQQSKAWHTEDQSEKTEIKTTPVKPQIVRILNSEAATKTATPAKKIVKIVKRTVPAEKPQVQHDSGEPQAKKSKIAEEVSLNLGLEEFEPQFEEVKVEDVGAATKIQENVPSPANPAKKSSPPPKKSPPKKKETPKAKKLQPKPKTSPEEIKKPDDPPTNKLLALIEVTPEQYEKLSKSLTSAERGDQISSLLNYFDKEDADLLSDADNGEFHRIFILF